MRRTLSAASQPDRRPGAPHLVDLLGDTRSQVVELLHASPRSVAALAGELELSEVAIRRHLRVLTRDGLVSARTVRRDGPGRPSAEYTLTAKARRLFPDGSAELANELLEFLEAEVGRAELHRFLRWRSGRQRERYAAALTAFDADDRLGRATRLAELLTEDGFLSDVGAVDVPNGATVLELRQGHCAIMDVAREHPEICAYEAALFQRVLGAKVSRRQTIAAGAGECICHITTTTPTESTPKLVRSESDGDAR